MYFLSGVLIGWFVGSGFTLWAVIHLAKRKRKMLDEMGVP
jgi:hypothetical protein